jgi:hypothetical protein
MASFRATTTMARFLAFLPPRVARESPSVAGPYRPRRGRGCIGHSRPAGTADQCRVLCDAKLAVLGSRSALPRAEAQVGADRAAAPEALGVVDREPMGER